MGVVDQRWVCITSWPVHCAQHHWPTDSTWQREKPLCIYLSAPFTSDTTINIACVFVYVGSATVVQGVCVDAIRLALSIAQLVGYMHLPRMQGCIPPKEAQCLSVENCSCTTLRDSHQMKKERSGWRTWPHSQALSQAFLHILFWGGGRPWNCVRTMGWMV